MVPVDRAWLALNAGVSHALLTKLVAKYPELDNDEDVITLSLLVRLTRLRLSPGDYAAGSELAKDILKGATDGANST